VISHPGWISSCRLINRGSWWGYRLEITFRLQLRWDPPSSFANVLVKNSTAEYLDLKSQIYGIYARWAVWGRQQLMNCNMGMESSAVANWGFLTPSQPSRPTFSNDLFQIFTLVLDLWPYKSQPANVLSRDPIPQSCLCSSKHVAPFHRDTMSMPQSVKFWLSSVRFSDGHK